MEIKKYTKKFVLKYQYKFCSKIEFDYPSVAETAAAVFA